MRVKILLIPALLLLILLPTRGMPRDPQIIIRPSPGEEMILALPDVQPLQADQAAQLAPMMKTFNEVLWDDLKFSGFFTLAG